MYNRWFFKSFSHLCFSVIFILRQIAGYALSGFVIFSIEGLTALARTYSTYLRTTHPPDHEVAPWFLKFVMPTGQNNLKHGT